MYMYMYIYMYHDIGMQRLGFIQKSRFKPETCKSRRCSSCSIKFWWSEHVQLQITSAKSTKQEPSLGIT